MNILLIEDEILIQKTLRKLLEREGAKVTVTASGKEASELLRVEDYQRVICDLMLRDTTGFDVIEESKSHFSANEIANKFIIITAYSSPDVLTKATKYGCDVIAKPFNDLPRIIQKFLKVEEQ